MVFSNLYLGTDLVFPEVTGLQLKVAYRRTCKRAGIKDFRFHDLGHIASQVI
jgi:integrase